MLLKALMPMCIVLAVVTTVTASCPFCSSVRQPLSEEMASADIVAIATIVPGSETDSDAVFKFEKILQGKKLLKVGAELPIPYFGSADSEQRFLLLGIDPPDLLWSFPRKVSGAAIEYLEKVLALPEDPTERLGFYLGYLEHEDEMLNQDAYDEFSGAAYDDVRLLKSKMNRERLLKWLQDLDISADHRRLYFVMLGICGKKEDAKLLEEMMKSDNPLERAGLDSLIGCYITLKGADGVGFVEDMFLKDKKREYGDTYAALQAIRFHGTEGGVVERKRLVKSLRLILERKEYADLVIPDLARWEDWSQMDRLVQLFRESDDETSWVRVPVINFLRACPLPEAKTKLDELKKLDPGAFKRAQVYFPVQGAGAWAPNLDAARGLAIRSLGERRPMAAPNRLGRWTRPVADWSVSLVGTKAQQVASFEPKTEEPTIRGRGEAAPLAVAGSKADSNRFRAISVLIAASVTCGLGMWVSLGGSR